jgi:hypothetical protein
MEITLYYEMLSWISSDTMPFFGLFKIKYTKNYPIVKELLPLLTIYEILVR